MDDMVNLGFSLVVVAPSPASSGTTLTVDSGDGAYLPSPPFNVTVGPSGIEWTRQNSEILRVTGKVGDVLTILREQEDSTARSIVVGDKIGATFTKKIIQDLIDEIGAPHVERIWIRNQTTGLYESMVMIGEGDQRQLVFE